MRVEDGWLVFTSWNGDMDHPLGTYLHLRNDGSATRITVRADEGDEEFDVMPPR